MRAKTRIRIIPSGTLLAVLVKPKTKLVNHRTYQYGRRKEGPSFVGSEGAEYYIFPRRNKIKQIRIHENGDVQNVLDDLRFRCSRWYPDQS